MLNRTKIEWATMSWNCLRGCLKISPGCAFCYAYRIAMENINNPKSPYYKVGFSPRLVPSRLLDPVKELQFQRVFVNSMSDMFHEAFSDDYIVDMCRVMEFTSWHAYVVLTKRPGRMKALLETKLAFAAKLPHIWWGVSVENNRHGLPRVGILKETPAAVRILSVEPLLEGLEGLDLEGINWCIVGGESEPNGKFRAMKEEWVKPILKECRRTGTAFFFKQWSGLQQGSGGCELNGQKYLEYPRQEVGPVKPFEERAAFIQQLSKKYKLRVPKEYKPSLF